MKVKKNFFHIFSLLTILSGTLTAPSLAIAETVSTSNTSITSEVDLDDTSEHSESTEDFTEETSNVPEQSSTENEETDSDSLMETTESSSEDAINEDALSVPIDVEHFPDEHFRQYIATLDSDGDGILSHEIASITTLDLSDKNIRSLEGIHFFTELTHLDVSNNDLQELDLQGLVHLESLDVSSNHLSVLDLSQNTELKHFVSGTQDHEITATFEENKYVVSVNDLFSEAVPEFKILTEGWHLNESNPAQLVGKEFKPLSLAVPVTMPDLSDEEATGGPSAKQIEEDEYQLLLDVSVTSPTTSLSEKSNISTINYQSFVEGQGWQEIKNNGATSGTTGQSKKILGFKILSDGLDDANSITYRGHFQNTGWGSWSPVNETIGDTSSNRQLESLQIRSTNQDIFYRVHVRGLGWLGWAKNGETSGTTGLGARIEAVQITFTAPSNLNEASMVEAGTINSAYQTFSNSSWSSPVGNGITSGTTGQGRPLQKFKMSTISTNFAGSVEYSGLVQNSSWSSYMSAGQEIGQTGRNLEGIRIRLTGELANMATVYYRVHVEGLGWLNWTKNGGNAGSTAYNLAIEAVQVIVKPKYLSDPTGQGLSFVSAANLGKATINLSTHVQRLGWSSTTGDNIRGGTTGQSLRVEGMKMNIANAELSGGISYKSHIQGIGWQAERSNGALSGTTGQSRRLEAVQVKLTGALARVYDVYYRVHSQTYGWLDWAVNDQKAGTISLGKRAEAIEIQLIPKGQKAPGSTEKPFVEKSEYLFVMGHGGWDPGAVGSGTNERDFTRNELLPYLRKYAAQLKTSKINFYDTSKDMYQDTQIMGGAYLVSSKILSVTEIHLDAGGALSTGGHVIVHKDLVPSSSSIAMAETIRQHVGWHSAFANNRGLSLRSDLLNLRVFKDRGIDYRLIELGFITNPNDVAKIRRNIDTIAKQLIQDATGERL